MDGGKDGGLEKKKRMRLKEGSKNGLGKKSGNGETARWREWRGEGLGGAGGGR